jgi:hypothetical protein
MAGDSSASRVTETEAGFNGDLLWAAVDSVDKAAEIHIFWLARGIECRIWFMVSSETREEVALRRSGERGVPRGTADAGSLCRHSSLAESYIQ